jgi:hypothetical protein
VALGMKIREDMCTWAVKDTSNVFGFICAGPKDEFGHSSLHAVDSLQLRSLGIYCGTLISKVI